MSDWRAGHNLEQLAEVHHEAVRRSNGFDEPQAAYNEISWLLRCGRAQGVKAVIDLVLEVARDAGLDADGLDAALGQELQRRSARRPRPR